MDGLKYSPRGRSDMVEPQSGNGLRALGDAFRADAGARFCDRGSGRQASPNIDLTGMHGVAEHDPCRDAQATAKAEWADVQANVVCLCNAGRRSGYAERGDVSIILSLMDEDGQTQSPAYIGCVDLLAREWRTARRHRSSIRGKGDSVACTSCWRNLSACKKFRSDGKNDIESEHGCRRRRMSGCRAVRTEALQTTCKRSSTTGNLSAREARKAKKATLARRGRGAKKATPVSGGRRARLEPPARKGQRARTAR